MAASPEAQTPVLISREDCALYFARRFVLVPLLTGSLLGGTLLLLQAANGAIFDQIAGPALQCAKLALFVLPAVGLFGAWMGEGLWRAYYQPPHSIWDTVQVCVRVSIELLGTGFFIWAAPPMLLAFLPFVGVLEWLTYRSTRAIRLRRRPDRATLIVLGVTIALFQAVLLKMLRTDFGLVTLLQQQTIVLGCNFLYLGFESTNILAAWYAEGRLPADGNPRFQISLKTTLLLTLAAGTWAALLVWWLR